MRKYELTEETTQHMGVTLFRIKALRDFSDVKQGDLGGFVETESNLSHKGNCWIYDDAIVMEGSNVRDNSKVMNNAVVYYNSIIRDNAEIHDDSTVGATIMSDNSRAIGRASMVKSTLEDNALICDNGRAENSKIIKNGVVSNSQYVQNTNVFKVLSTDIKESIRCQINTYPIKGKIIAYRSTLNDKFGYLENRVYKTENLIDKNIWFSGILEQSLFFKGGGKYKDNIMIVEIEVDDIIKIDGGSIHCKKFKVLENINYRNLDKGDE